MTNKGLSVFGLIIGGCLVIVSIIVAYAIYQVRSLDNVISVSGYSQKIITSDVGKWNSYISRQADTSKLSDSYRLMKGDLEKVMAFLKANGVEEKDITVGVIDVQTNYNYGSNYGGKSGEITGYNLTQNIQVQLSDVEKITRIAQKSGELIDQGVTFASRPLEYYYSKLADIKLEMLSKATEDAQVRASKIAESSGSKVGKIKSASQGVFQITQVNSTDVSDYGSYDTSSIEKQITSVVRASFVMQ